jgi:putative thioredoxin
MAFVDGEPIDAFVGALPESQLREFIDRLLPNPSEIERRRARRLAEQGQLAEAVAALRAAIALDPNAAQAQLDLAEILLERLPGAADELRMAEAERALAAAGSALREDARWRALSTRLASLKGAGSRPADDALRARVEANPADLQARLDLAQWHIEQRQFEPALAQLTEGVEHERTFLEEVQDALGLRVQLAGQHPSCRTIDVLRQR